VTLLIVRMGTEFNERKSRALRVNSVRALVPARPQPDGPAPAGSVMLR
jgi:hypothetical protein